MPGGIGKIAALPSGDHFRMELGGNGGAGIFGNRRLRHARECIGIGKTSGHRGIAPSLVDEQDKRLAVRQAAIVGAMVVFGQAAADDFSGDGFGRIAFGGGEFGGFKQRFEIAGLACVVVAAAAVHHHAGRALLASGLQRTQEAVLKCQVWQAVARSGGAGAISRRLVPPAGDAAVARCGEPASLRLETAHGGHFAAQLPETGREDVDGLSGHDTLRAGFSAADGSSKAAGCGVPLVRADVRTGSSAWRPWAL